MAETKIDTFLILGEINRFYFTKVDTSFGCLIISEKEKVYITDFRYEAYVKEVLKDYKVIIVGGGKLMPTINEELKRLEAKVVGFEEDVLTVSEFKGIRSACPDFIFTPAGSLISAQRAVKTKEEIDLIASAQIIAQKALEKVVSKLKVGVTEREVAAELIYEMMMNGADDVSFDTIVAFGPNSAVPHHKTGDKRLEKNDIILIDMGAKARGYCSDMTRTFSLGEVGEQLSTIHNIVLEAQNYALKHIKAGMTGHEADSLAREYIMANGYAKEFGHSLGHGVGVEVHEGPRLSVGSKDILKPNMIVTIEPGIYVEGLGGVRIEDLIVITEGGSINLTSFNKNINL